MLTLPLKEPFTENLPKLQATKEKDRLNNVKITYKAICMQLLKQYSRRRPPMDQGDYHSGYLPYKKLGRGFHHVKKLAARS